MYISICQSTVWGARACCGKKASGRCLLFTAQVSVPHEPTAHVHPQVRATAPLPPPSRGPPPTMQYLPGRFGRRSGLATPTTGARARAIRRLTTRQMADKRVRVPTSEPDVDVEVS